MLYKLLQQQNTTISFLTLSLYFLFSSWRGPRFPLGPPSSATQFVSTSFSHHSSLPSSTSSVTGHCWSERLSGHHFPQWGLVGRPEWLDRWRHPRGQEEERAAQEGKTLHPVRPRPSPPPTGRPAEPPVKRPLGQSVLTCDRGQTKEMEILQPDSIHHNLSLRRLTRRAGATHRSLQGTQADMFLWPAVGQACCATISTISVVASKHKRTCVLVLCLSCLSIVAFESQSLTSVSVLNKRTLMSFNNTYSRGEATCRLLKDVFNFGLKRVFLLSRKKPPKYFWLILN